DDAALAGEPEIAVTIERASIEIGIRRSVGKREHSDDAIRPPDSDDRLLSTVRNPGRLVRTLNHPVRCGSCAQRNQFGTTCRRIEITKVATRLCGEPDAAVRR